MIKRIKIILTGLFLSIFVAQAVLACACEVDMGHSAAHDEISHDHHQMMDHEEDHINTDHFCEGNCHLSFEEQDGSDFVAAQSSISNVDKNFDAKVAHYLTLTDARPDKGLVTFSRRQNLPPPPTLYSQGILLLI